MKSTTIIGLTTVMVMIAWPVMAADVFVYPKNNQTKELQEQDEFSCCKWVKGQTGFDPTKPVEQAGAQAPKGGAVSGGAARGAPVGAIGGDAGKGAGVGAAAGAHKRRKSEGQQEAAQQQAAKQQETNVAGYHRAFGACMEGKGYTVK